MKTLTLLRHAKSGWDDTVSRDFDRPLNPKGKRAAQVMGRHLRTLADGFGRVVASPALRVAETLAEVERGFGRPLVATPDRRIYLASAATLLDVVRDLPDEVDTALLAGHNPGLEDLVLMLVPERGEAGHDPAVGAGVGDAALRDDVETKFPTASLAELHLPVARWQDVGAGGATLARFVRPRDLDPALGPDGT